MTTRENTPEHAADPHDYWGSRGRRFKSCQPDSVRASAGHRLAEAPFLHDQRVTPVQHAAYRPFDSAGVPMPASTLIKLTDGLSRTWAGFLRDWDRSLRAANHPETTRYNYLLAAAQLGRYLAETHPTRT